MEPSVPSLKRQVRKLQQLMWLQFCVLVICVLLLAWLFFRSPALVQAQAFELIDENHNTRGQWKIEDGQPLFSLRDQDGVERIRLFHQADASGLFVKDHHDTTRIGIAQFAHGGGGVALHGAESKGAAVLYFKESGSLRFFDTYGSVTNAVMAVSSDKQSE